VFRAASARFLGCGSPFSEDRVSALRLGGREEPLDEAVSGGVALDVVGVDVEGERDDGVAVGISVSYTIR
jgi:hypothetical protein